MFLISVMGFLGKNRGTISGFLNPVTIVLVVTIFSDIYFLILSIWIWRAADVILELDLIYRSKADLKLMYGMN